MSDGIHGHIRVEIDPSLKEGEAVLRCRDETQAEALCALLGDRVADDRIARAAAGGMKAPTRAADAPDAPSPPLVFFKDKQEFRFPADTVLFFETDGGDVYAHTANDAFQVRERLYELSDILPPSFLRVSKSAILNAHKVYSIQRNLTASSRVEFEGSHKVLYVSRFYYKALHKYLDSH